MHHHTTQQLSSLPSDSLAPPEHDYDMLSPVAQHPIPEGGHSHIEGAEHHKSVIGLVREKAHKLKEKMKKHKDHGDGNTNESSGAEDESEDENGIPHQVVEGNKAPGSVLIHHLEGASLVPDPNAASLGSDVGVHEAFGNLTLTDTEHLQEHLPSAAGQASAGVTPYLAAHGFGGKAPESSEAQIPNVIPSTAVVSEKTESKTEKFSEDGGQTELFNKASGEELPEESKSLVETSMQQEGKAIQGHVDEGVTTTAPDKDPNSTEPRKSMLEQAKERIFGSSKPGDGSPDKHSEKKPSITSRAADTMISLKDVVVSKLGYGTKSSPKRSETRELKEEVLPLDTDKQNLNQSSSSQSAGEGSQTSGTTVGKLQESAGQLIDTVVSNVHKVQAAAIEAEEALVSKLGYETKKDETREEGREGELAASGNVTGESESRTITSEGSNQQYDASAATRFHPGEEDRALSQLITEKLSLGASSLKGTLMRPFGSSKSRPSTPVTTETPAAAAAAESAVSRDEAAITAHETPAASETRTEDQSGDSQGFAGKVTETIDSLLGTHISQGETEPGVVGKVSEAISSMLGGESAPEKESSGATEGCHERGVGMEQ